MSVSDGYALWVQALAVLIFTPIFVAGVVGNLMVIIVVLRNRQMHTATNIFITQLAVGDLMMVLFCLPYTVPTIYIIRDWVFGDIWCKVVLFVQTAGCFISVITLTAMSIERYFVLLHPMQARNWWTKSTALKIGGLIYVASGLLALPRSLFGGILSASLDPETGELVEEEDKENGTVYDVNTQCWDEVPSVFFTYYTIFRIVFLYLIPSAMIAVFYGKIAQHLQKTTLNESLSNDKVIQTRRKVIRMLLAMISAFVLCWLPVYILSVLELLPEGRKYLAESTWMACYLFFCVVAVYFSCISNPILYTFMSSQYRTAFHRMLRCGRLGRQHNRDQKKTTSDTDSGSLSKSTKSEVVSSGNTFWTMRKSTNLIRSD